MEDLFLESFIDAGFDGGGYESNYLFSPQEQALYDNYYSMSCRELYVEIRAMDLNLGRMYQANTYNEYDRAIESYEWQQEIAMMAYVDKSDAGIC